MDATAPSGGLVAGLGSTWWIHPRVGVVSDLMFRLLIGAEVREVLSFALGVSARL